MNMFAIGAMIMGVLCILCLVGSIAVLIKVQALHSVCVSILKFTLYWLEQSRHEQEDSKDV